MAILAVVLVVVAAVAVYATYYLPGSSSTTTPVIQTVQVSIPSGVGGNQGLTFQPATIRVTVGVNNTIVWTNGDSVVHTVTSTSVPSGATAFDSGNVNAGKSFSVTLTVPGTYQYHCAIHSWMTGTIVVSG